MAYKVLINCENDKTEKSFQRGDVVSEKDLPKGVIEHWLRKGVLEEIPEAKAPAKSAKGKED